jgi:predicted RNA binding protein YcfA (HicA-like mRNA interferase family)
MLKNISFKNLVIKFKNLGFGGPYAGGKHLFMSKEDFKIHIPNPHKGDISKSLVAEILRQAGISKDDWNDA